MSSDVIKALYEGTGSLMEMVDVHLLSMTVNCIHPPCLYSYFYSLENESNHENNDNIPSFMALAIGLAAAPLNGVVFPWSYDTIQVMGCIEDMYGSTTCTLEPYTPSTLSSGSNHTSHPTLDICDYINDIGSHLALLSKVGDALRLSQFVSAVVLEMIGRETRDGDNRECVQHTMNMIFEYIHNVLVHTEYFGFYPFPILQILYLTSRHSLVPSTSYITFNALYNEFNAFNSNTSHSTAEVFYYPYSDSKYMKWNRSLVDESISRFSDVLSVLSALEMTRLNCFSFTFGTISSNLMNDLSDLLQKLSSLMKIWSLHQWNEFIEFTTDSMYIYAIRYIPVIDIDNPVLDIQVTEQHKVDIELLSVHLRNMNAVQTVEIQLVSFASSFVNITKDCLQNENHNAAINHFVYISFEFVDYVHSVDFEQDLNVTMKGRLSPNLKEKVVGSDSIDIQCRTLHRESMEWFMDHCHSIMNMETMDPSHDTLEFECECRMRLNVSFNGMMPMMFGLVVGHEHDFQNEVVFGVEPMGNTGSNVGKIQILSTYHWATLLGVFVALLLGGFLVPLSVFPQSNVQCGNGGDLVHYSYITVVIFNFGMEIYVCFVALTQENAIWIWQMEVIFGIECAALGVMNALLLVIINDDRCNNFQYITPRVLSLCNFLSTLVIVIMAIFHGYFTGTHQEEYVPFPWGLWIIYLCLVLLFVTYLVHCSYYWYRGKTLASGAPFAYTEGARETIAIMAMVLALSMYLLTAVNGYMIYAIPVHSDEGAYILCFEVIHVLSLSLLAAVMIAVRRFESRHHLVNRRKGKHESVHTNDSVEWDARYEHVDDDRDGDDEMEANQVMLNIDRNVDQDHDGSIKFSRAAVAGCASVSAGGARSGSASGSGSGSASGCDDRERVIISNDSRPIPIPLRTAQQSNSSSIDTDEASSTLDTFEHDQRRYLHIVPNAQLRELDESKLDIIRDRDEVSPLHHADNDRHGAVAGYLTAPNIPGPRSRTGPTARTVTASQSPHLGTDAMGNTMSYEPEMEHEMGFMEVATVRSATRSGATNQEEEGARSPKSDGELMAAAGRGMKSTHNRHHSGKWRRNRRLKGQDAVRYGDEYDRDHSLGDKVRYSPYDNMENETGYLYPRNAMNDDDVEQPSRARHVAGNSMSISKEHLVESSFRRRRMRRRGTNCSMETLSDGDCPMPSQLSQGGHGMYFGPLPPEESRRKRQRMGQPGDDAEPTMTNASSSSLGIFDWNTPPPVNKLAVVSAVEQLDLGDWIHTPSRSADKTTQSLSKDTNGPAITRRHTAGPGAFRKRKTAPNTMRRTFSAQNELSGLRNEIRGNVHHSGYRQEMMMEQTASNEYGDSGSLVQSSKENPFSNTITPFDVENARHSQFVFTAAHPVDARPSSEATTANEWNPSAAVHPEAAPLSLGLHPQKMPSSERDSVPQYGSGAHPSVRMQSDSMPRPSSHAPSIEEDERGQSTNEMVSIAQNGKKERFRREKVEMKGNGVSDQSKKAGLCLVRNEYGDVKLQQLPLPPRGAGHSRNTTASSFTGTFTLPQYPNIVTANDDDEHRDIMATHNLMAVPLKRRLTDLDANQKEVIQVFEGGANNGEAENHQKSVDVTAAERDSTRPARSGDDHR